VSGVLQLATAGPRSCALTDQGVVTCWGRTLEPGSALAQTGLRHFAMVDLLACVQTIDGTVRCPHLPFDVVSGWKHARQVALGQNLSACALLDSGRVECWQGDPNAASMTPFASDQDPTADLPIQLAAGAAHVCALKAGGSVWCWGQPNAAAGLCGQASCAATAARIDLPPAHHITSGWETSCAVTAGNRLYCWGRRLTTNTFGGPIHVPGPWE
jgi:alpha-tubulin suppressor-like RCC1 family protein